MFANMTEEKQRPQKKTGLTTFKLKAGIADTLAQIAALKGIQKQEVLDEYAAQFENDLLRLLAKRQAELKKKPG